MSQPVIRPKSITYRRTIQVELFEPENYEATYDVPDGVDPHVVAQAAKRFVEECWGLREPEPTAAPEDDAVDEPEFPF